MTSISEKRLEACRASIQSILDYGDDCRIIFMPNWAQARAKGPNLSRLISSRRRYSFAFLFTLTKKARKGQSLNRRLR